jgi:hypothetical protein
LSFHKCSKYLILLLLTSIVSAYTQTVNVPLGHWAYDVLERFETRRLINGVLNGSRPMTRQQIGRYVDSLILVREADGHLFSRVDKQWLAELQREFYEEIKGPKPIDNSIEAAKNSWLFRSWWPDTLYANNRNFFHLEWDPFYFYIDPILRYVQGKGDYFGKYTTSGHLSNGFTFRGSLGAYTGFYFDFTDNTHSLGIAPKSPGAVIPNSGLPWINRQDPEKLLYDENVAYLMLSIPYFDFEIGRDYAQWGPMHNGQLALSSNAPAFDMLRFNLSVWRLKFTGLTGFLEHIPDSAVAKPSAVAKEKKFIAAARLEIDAGIGLQLGLNQFVVYGRRDIEIGYLLPFFFYKGSEHYYQDRDNGLLGLDFDWNIYPGYKLYGEFLFDDISTTKIGTDFYGNKYAFGLGFLTVHPLGLNDFSLRTEYYRIQPYVYTHKNDISRYNQYYSNLGHFLQPNSDMISGQASYWLSRRFWLDLRGEYIRHGENLPDRNVGGDINRPFTSGDNRDVKFLDGNLRKYSRVSIRASFEIIRRGLIFAEIGERWSDDQDADLIWEVGLSLNYGQKQRR